MSCRTKKKTGLTKIHWKKKSGLCRRVNEVQTRKRYISSNSNSPSLVSLALSLLWYVAPSPATLTNSQLEFVIGVSEPPAETCPPADSCTKFQSSSISFSDPEVLLSAGDTLPDPGEMGGDSSAIML